MSALSDRDTPFVLCKNCIRTFDVHNYWQKGYSKNIEIVDNYPNSSNPDVDGFTTVFNAECPYCFNTTAYNDTDDVIYPEMHDSKLRDAYKAENEALRKQVIQQERKINRLERSEMKLDADCKRLADIIHTLKTGNKPPTSRQRKTKVKAGQTPYN